MADTRPVEKQVQSLVILANQMGMFDAALWLQERLPEDQRVPDMETFLAVLDRG